MTWKYHVTLQMLRKINFIGLSAVLTRLFAFDRQMKLTVYATFLMVGSGSSVTPTNNQNQPERRQNQERLTVEAEHFLRGKVSINF